VLRKISSSSQTLSELEVSKTILMMMPLFFVFRSYFMSDVILSVAVKKDTLRFEFACHSGG